MKVGSFFAELKRRNVYKVAIAYAVIAWLLMQIATQVFPFLEIPNWAIRLVIMLLALGFPILLRVLDVVARARIARSIGKSSWTISAKPVGVGAASQRLIPEGERSGLQTRIATTESVSLCERMKS
jgi:hypothetical protein